MSDAINQMYKDTSNIDSLIARSPHQGYPPWPSREDWFRKQKPFSIDLLTDVIKDFEFQKVIMKKRPFQYMVLLHEYEQKEGKNEYKDSKVIIDLKTVMAKSEKELVFKITREIPEQFAGEPDNVEIIIRPF